MTATKIHDLPTPGSRDDDDIIRSRAAWRLSVPLDGDYVVWTSAVHTDDGMVNEVAIVPDGRSVPYAIAIESGTHDPKEALRRHGYTVVEGWICVGCGTQWEQMPAVGFGGCPRCQEKPC